MNLTTKINLILAATFMLALSLIGVNSYLLTENNALQQVTDQAELIMQQALAVRRTVRSVFRYCESFRGGYLLLVGGEGGQEGIS